jgi:uncharacterized tellurite resistance protein B-like protein
MTGEEMTKRVKSILDTSMASFKETMSEDDARLAIIALTATMVTLQNAKLPISDVKYAEVLRVLANIIELTCKERDGE